MSAESVHMHADSKKRSFDTISQKKAQFFTFPNHKVALNRQRPSHNFHAVSNEHIKARYGHIHTPKGGKRSEKRSGSRTRRHRIRRTRRAH